MPTAMRVGASRFFFYRFSVGPADCHSHFDTRPDSLRCSRRAGRARSYRQRPTGNVRRERRLRIRRQGMSSASKRHDADPVGVRVPSRGLRARRGVHLTLRSLRDAAGKTQNDVSAASGINQGDMSRLESRELLDECVVSTLQRYIAALGGTLEVTAVFGANRIAVVGSAPTSGKPANSARQRKGRKATRG